MRRYTPHLIVAIVAAVIGALTGSYFDTFFSNPEEPPSQEAEQYAPARTLGTDLVSTQESAEVKVLLFELDGQTPYPDYELAIHSQSFEKDGLYRFRLVATSADDRPLVQLRQFLPGKEPGKFKVPSTGCSIYLDYPKSIYLRDLGLGMIILTTANLDGATCDLTSPTY